MEIQEAIDPPSEMRVLLVAHCFDANFSMESRLSWVRATQAAEHYPSTLICAEPFADVRSDVHAQIPGLKIVTVAHTSFEKWLISTPFGFYLAYRLWHWRVMQVARNMHRRKPFSLVHQISYCGYREPGYCWKLGIPFVWGPIGGTQNVPWNFLGQLDLLGALKESWRNVANSIQLKFGHRVGNALQAAKAVYVANSEAQRSFQRTRGVELSCQLETGLHDICTRQSPMRDRQRPLRVLWVGRLESWKALPLLLKAVARVPADTPLELRIVGSGSRKERWQRMAAALGIADRVQWIPLPEYGDRNQHYQWADVLAFTSLRDTSGTGLLEALAAGVPILGLDHQGARDIMAADCALSIPVKYPQQVIDDLRDGLNKLADDPELLRRLSDGALRRAYRFHWDQLGEEMIACYQNVLHESCPATTNQTTTVEQTSEAESTLSLSPRVTAG